MIKVKAVIYLYKHRGRKTSFTNGYRPAFSFNQNDDEYLMGNIELIHSEEFALGTLGEVFITFNSDKYLKVGRTFSINEPPNEIGEGEILEIINV